MADISVINWYHIGVKKTKYHSGNLLGVIHLNICIEHDVLGVIYVNSEHWAVLQIEPAVYFGTGFRSLNCMILLKRKLKIGARTLL